MVTWQPRINTLRVITPTIWKNLLDVNTPGEDIGCDEDLLQTISESISRHLLRALDRHVCKCIYRSNNHEFLSKVFLGELAFVIFSLPVENNKALLDGELSREESDCMSLSCHLLDQPVHSLSRVAEDHRLQLKGQQDAFNSWTPGR